MRNRGSALIESLVAMAVFAIGSAATGAWFMQSMAQGARASRMMAATVIAVSLEGRLRANRPAAVDGHYRKGPGATQDCANGCNSRELASDDMIRFHRMLRERLGDGATGDVGCDAYGRCIIVIQWRTRERLTWHVVL
jgi:type II secretory pathway pseudopilin PulG